jgi:hypothetical protein
VTMTSEQEGTDPDGTPVGLLAWGQAGIYNAVDDRLVIAAAADAGVGIVRPATVTPGTGLTLNVAAGWLGIASCDDGTRAIAGSRQSHQVTMAAGPASGSRMDYVWCDTYPDEGKWRLRVVQQGSERGRTGMALARVTAPAGANLASQMTIDRNVPSFGPQTDYAVRQNATTSLFTLTRHYQIAPWAEVAGALHVVRAFGTGNPVSATGRDTFWRTVWPDSPILRLPTGGGAMGGYFVWEAEVALMIRDPVANIGDMKVSVSATSNAGQNGTAVTRSGTAVKIGGKYGTGTDLSWHQIEVQGAFSQTDNGNFLWCQDSWYQAIQPQG